MRVSVFIDGANFFFMQRDGLKWFADPKKMLEYSPISEKSFVELNGKSRIEVFQLERAPGKLRRQYIYDDTIQLIKDMMREEGVTGKFANVLEEKRYYPESYFYQMIGFPENIILYNKYYDEMRRAIHDKSRFTQ